MTLLDDLGLDLSDETAPDETSPPRLVTLRDHCDLDRIVDALGTDHVLLAVTIVVPRMYRDGGRAKLTRNPDGSWARHLPANITMPLAVSLALATGDLALISRTTMPVVIIQEVAQRLRWLASRPVIEDGDFDDPGDFDGLVDGTGGNGIEGTDTEDR